MKKMILLLAVLLMTAPAMAAVTITVSDSGDGWAVISYDANGAPDFIRAFALDITASNDVSIVDYSDADANYWVYPGSIDINELGGVNDVGNPIALSSFPGTLSGIDTNAVTIEMGALFEAGVQGPPSASGVLLKLQLDPGAAADGAEICVVGNAIRGNIVLKNASSEAPAEACAVVDVAPGGLCPGDVTGTVSGWVMGPPPDFINYFDISLWEGPSGTLNSTDVQALIYLLTDESGSVSPVPAEALAGDVTGTVSGWVMGPPPDFINYFDINLWEGPNGTLNSTDVQALIYLLTDSSGSYTCP